jgi:deazaflavin-dependent oxidoreductase (nitroreductase family)
MNPKIEGPDMDEARPATRPAPFIPTPRLVNRLISPLIMQLGVATTLVVEGRTSGRARRTPVAPIEVAGQRYLVAYPGLSHWVRNLRAVGRGELRRRSVVEAFVAFEVDGAERDRVVDAYRAAAPKYVRKVFEKIPAPADHPTFRIEPAIEAT